MSKVKDLTGLKFGKLTVIKRAGRSKEGRATWLCKCDCRNEKVLLGKSILSGSTRSCGCLEKENRNKIKDLNKTHGKSRTKLYSVWNNMKRRCYNIKNNQFKNYGARGIKVCDEWKNDFQAFCDWAIKNGYDENAERGKCTIDRIDVNGNYEANNCRFVDNKTQSLNKRTNRIISYNGETKTMSEWAKEFGVSHSTIKYRQEHGLDLSSGK